MKKAKLLKAVFGIIVIYCGMAWAEDEISIGITTDYFSKYIWRGQNIDDKSVLQPAVSAGAYGFTGSVWGNIDLTNDSLTAPDNAWEFSEFDYTFDYTATVPDVNWLNFSVGTIYYRFPNTPFRPTTEIYSGLSLSVPFSPCIKLCHDVDEIDGSYVQFGLGHTLEKIYTISETCYCDLQSGASIGWGSADYNKGYFGVNNNEFNDLSFSAGLPVCLDSWIIKPSVSYSTMIGDKIRKATVKSDNVWIGVGLSKSF